MRSEFESHSLCSLSTRLLASLVCVAWVGITAIATPRPIATVPLARSAPSAHNPRIAQPIVFEPNLGQVAPRVLYVARIDRVTALFLRNEVIFSAEGGDERRRQIHMRFCGARDPKSVVGQRQVPGAINVMRGSDPSRWRTADHGFAAVRYEGLYPGVDIVFSASAGRLEYTVVVGPGFGADQVNVAFDGNTDLRRRSDGTLEFDAGPFAVEHHRPRSFVIGSEQARAVSSDAYLDGDSSLRFRLAARDEGSQLAITPSITFSTRLGGDGAHTRNDIVVDAQGNAYFVANTAATNYPVVDGFQGDQPGGDIVVTKVAADGSAYIYSTYLGGDGYDSGFGIVVAPNGAVTIVGSTDSTNYPVTGGVQTTRAGPGDGVITRLSPSGNSLVFSTLLGGSAYDYLFAIATDSSDSIYVTGTTSSPDFPNTAGITTFGNGGTFITKLAPFATAVAYSVLIDGSGNENGRDIAVNGAGEAIIVGETSSTNFPIRNAVQPSHSSGAGNDVFVTKVNAAGNDFVFSTYLGGSGEDTGRRIALDSQGNTVVAGSAGGPGFPLHLAYDATYGGNTGLDAEAFVTKLAPAGQFVFSTYLGGSAGDGIYGLALDSRGNIFVGGFTGSQDFPLIPTSSLGSSCCAGFLSRFSSDGQTLQRSSTVGTHRPDGGIALKDPTAVWLLGDELINGFLPLTNPIYTTGEGMLIRFDASVTNLVGSLVPSSPTASPGGQMAYTYTVTNQGPDDAVNILASQGVADLQTYVSCSASAGMCTLAQPTIVQVTQPVLTLGSSLSITGVWNVSAVNGQTIFGSGSASSSTLEINTTDNGDSEQLPVVGPDCTISKAHVGDFVVGGLGQYQIIVTNVGQGATTSAITVTDTLPNGLTYVSGSGTGWSFQNSSQTVVATSTDPLAAGQSTSILFNVAVSAAARPSVTNQVTVAVAHDANPANNSSSDLTVVVDAPLTDVALSKTHGEAFVVGQNGAYVLRLTNTGNRPTDGVITLTDTLPTGLTFVAGVGDGWSVGVSGQTVTATRSTPIGVGAMSDVALTVAIAPEAFPSVTNSASVSYASDGNASNNIASDVTAIGAGAADLEVTLTESADPVPTGAQIAYALVVHNIGPLPAVGAVATLNVPQGTTFVGCSASQGSCFGPPVGATGTVSVQLGSIAAGASATVTVVAVVIANAGATISCTATATSSSPDGTTGNNQATAATSVRAALGTADLGLTVVADRTEAAPGDLVTYTIRLMNFGPDSGQEIVVLNPVPAGSVFNSAEATAGTLEAPPSGESGLIEWSLPTLDSAAEAQMVLTVRLLAPTGSEITNVATAVAGSSDPVLANNVATTIVSIQNPVEPPVISRVEELSAQGKPYRLRIVGMRFANGVEVIIGSDAEAWDDVRRKNDRKIVVGRGRRLRDRFPLGVPVMLRVRNPDGGEATATFTRT